MIGHELDLDEILGSFVAFGFAFFQFDKFLQGLGIALAPSGQDPPESYFLRSLDSNQLEVFGRAEGLDFGRISDRVDHIVLVVFDPCQDAFGKNLSPMLLAQLVSDGDQQITRRLKTARADFVANDVGERVVVETFRLQVSSNFAFARRISASKSY